MKDTLPIVGIGASAGGLKAITEFFDHVSPNPGMAFVVIQHLSSDFKSMMSELLQKHTDMEIQVIDKPTSISPNHIYLISSLHNVILDGNMLKPIKRSDPQSINLPIDIFFHSLGKEHAQNTVGIILSGTGSDGSKGIETIRKAGGLVMVEDPHYSQFDGMPRAAISASKVDYILPPYALARELLRIKSGKAKDKDFLIINPKDPHFNFLFEAIIEEVYARTGINFSDYRNSTLIRRMEKRMFITKQADLESYLRFIRIDKNEVHILQQEFLINVTHFFRDNEAFDELNTNVIPNIVKSKKPHEQIRIWIPACSTGQEAISIAILVKEYLEKHNLSNPLKIFASDIDKAAIATASEGIYESSLLAQLPIGLLEKYFEPVNLEVAKFAVIKSLRENIVYVVHDSIYDPPFINMDLVSCRNMMIYLNTKNQKMLLANFHFALNFSGYLFLGPSESLGDIKSAFSVISSKWNIFQNTSKDKLINPPFVQNRAVNSRFENANPKNKELPLVPELSRIKSQSEDKVYIKLLIEEFAPTCIIVNEALDILLSNGDLGEVLSFPKVSGNFNLKEMVQNDELIIFKNGMRKCKEKDTIYLYKDLAFRKKQKRLKINIQFRALKLSNHIFDEVFIIEFLNIENDSSNEQSTRNKEVVSLDRYKNEKITTIEKELDRVQYEKRLLIQQLETTNEELQSSNEELLAANEELQSTNEELQSVNEELYTVNTELQNKVNQLISTTNDLDNLLNSTEIGSVFLDKELNIRRFTPAIKQQFDLLERDIGRSITTFTNSFLDKSIYLEINKVVKHLVIYEKEIEDDKGNFYLMRVLPYQTEGGQIDGAILTFVPINELKKANENFERAAEIYRAVFENSYDNIILFEKNYTIDSSNFAFAGYSKERIVGKSILKVFPQDHRKHLKNSIAEVLDGSASSFFQFESENNNSEKNYFSATVTPVIIHDQVYCLALITRDITKLKIKELELRQMSVSLEKQVQERSVELNERNKELNSMNVYLDSFVHGAAHDLRAPITQIKGMMQLVPEIKDIEKKESVFSDVADCIKHLEKTLNGLIEMIDFQKNSQPISHEISFEQTFNAVRDQLKKDIADSKATLNVDIPKELKVDFIQAYITSIFYNLLSNAIKYRSYERNLVIDISVKLEQGFAVIIFKDNGIGIDLNRYGHFLFQPFKRLTLQREGSGIGLSIINSVVRKNGGRIEVESKLDKGTTFKVFINPLI
jgi:two-component system CheB/CheR fusion protein